MRTAFSWNRCSLVIKWLLGRDRIRLIILMAVAFSVGVFSMLFLISNINSGPMRSLPMGQSYSIALNATGGFISVLLLAYFVIVPAFAVYNMRHKQGAITFLSLPASTFEKFIARGVTLIGFGLLALFIGIVAFDVLQFIIALILPDAKAQSLTWKIVLDVFSMLKKAVTTQGGLMFLSVVCCMHSVYLLGGLLLRRMQWLIVSLFFLLIFVACFIITFKGSPELISFISAKGFLITMIAVLFVVAVFNTLLAYRRYKHFQVVR